MLVDAKAEAETATRDIATLKRASESGGKSKIAPMRVCSGPCQSVTGC